jgi:hypothetical protein
MRGSFSSAENTVPVIVRCPKEVKAVKLKAIPSKSALTTAEFLKILFIN